jgi:uncharacterized protein HemX
MSPGESAVRGILNHWPLVAALIAGAVTWGMTSQRVAALEQRAETAQINREQLIRIESEVRHLTSELDEIKDTKRATRAEVEVNQGHIIEIKAQVELLLQRLLADDKQ